MIELIQKNTYLKMPWKNKKGVTSQIYLGPSTASFERLDFDFRLSSAPILENTTFSIFPGYERILLPIRGRGFYLNGVPYEQNEVAYFNADIETRCELIDGEVLDLGLIYNPKKIKTQVRIVNFKNSFSFNTEPTDRYLIYILKGSTKLNDVEGAQDDTYLIEGDSVLNFNSDKNTTLAIFKISLDK